MEIWVNLSNVFAFSRDMAVDRVATSEFFPPYANAPSTSALTFCSVYLQNGETVSTTYDLAWDNQSMAAMQTAPRFVTTTFDSPGRTGKLIRKVKCEYCGKEFRSSIYARHKRVHFGITPFRCVVCAKMFTQRTSAISHARVVHKNTEDPDSLIVRVS